MALMFVRSLQPVISRGCCSVMTGMIRVGLAQCCGLFFATSCRNRRVRCHRLQGQDQHQQPNGD